jgi:hypothetical protein
MKAKQLDPDLFPRKELVEAYQAVGQDYEPTVHDRTWDEWYPLVAADPVKDQEIEQRISQLYRTKVKGKEYLFYDITLYGHDWQGNRKDFYYREGMIEHMPEFSKRIDPATHAVIPEWTQVQDMKIVYTIRFTKDKVNELQEYFTEPVSLVVIDSNTRRRYGCNPLAEFRDLAYEELIELKTGFRDYIRNKRLMQQEQQQQNKGQLQKSGVR